MDEDDTLSYEMQLNVRLNKAESDIITLSNLVNTLITDTNELILKVSNLEAQTEDYEDQGV